MSYSAVRNWAARWRQKFGGKHMRLRVEDPIPVDGRAPRQGGEKLSRQLRSRAEQEFQKSRQT